MPKLFKHPPPVRSALLCNDVLKEINNKLIIVGVYFNDIIVSKIPAKLRFTLFVEYVPTQTGDEDVNFRVFLSGNEVVRLNGNLAGATKGVPTPIIIGPIEVGVDAEAEFQIDICYAGGKWHPLIRKSISVGEVKMLTNIPPLPSPSGLPGDL